MPATSQFSVEAKLSFGAVFCLLIGPSYHMLRMCPRFFLDGEAPRSINWSLRIERWFRDRERTPSGKADGLTECRGRSGRKAARRGHRDARGPASSWQRSGTAAHATGIPRGCSLPEHVVCSGGSHSRRSLARNPRRRTRGALAPLPKSARPVNGSHDGSKR